MNAPLSTIRVEADGAGECYVPDVFADNVRLIVAGLDFAGAWSRRAHRHMTAQELRSVATAARQLADSADEWANEVEQ